MRRAAESPALKRIPVDDLRVGMQVDDIVGTWLEHPFWRTRFPVRSERDIQRLRSSGVREVWIDTARGADVDDPGRSVTREATEQEVTRRLSDAGTGTQPVAAPPQRPIAPAVRFDEEMSRGVALSRKAAAAVQEAFHRARLGQSPDAGAFDALVDQIVSSVDRNATTLASLARLKGDDGYTSQHSVAVAALMTALARQLGLDDAMVRAAGRAGLAHDVGMALVPDAIARKRADLDESEWQQVRRHPEHGAALLGRLPVPDADVVEVCLHHHEKFDGSGYPHALAGEAIPLLSRIAAICDVYDAVTSDRPWRPGLPPSEAVRKLAEWGGHFDERVFQAFVRTVGIYPIGTLVRLESRRVAVVTDHHPGNLMQPTVRVFFSLRSQAHIPPENMDLSRPGCMDRIVEREPVDAYDAGRIEEIWAGSAARRRSRQGQPA